MHLTIRDFGPHLTALQGLSIAVRSLTVGGVVRAHGRSAGAHTPAVPDGFRYCIIGERGELLGRYLDAFECADDLLTCRGGDQRSTAEVDAERLERAAPGIVARVDYGRKMRARSLARLAAARSKLLGAMNARPDS